VLSVKPWRAEAVARLFLGLFTSICFGALLVTWLSPKEAESKSGGITFLALAVSTLTFHGVGLVLIRQLLWEHDIGWRSAFGLKREHLARALWWSALVGLAAPPLASLLGGAWGHVLTWLHWKPVAQSAVQLLQQHQNAPNYQTLVIGMLAIFIAPVIEEMLFRGVLYPCIKQAGYPGVALWGTSLFFAATHANMATLVPLMVFAMVLTWLYEKFDNLAAPMIAHSLFNLANFCYMVFLTGDK